MATSATAEKLVAASFRQCGRWPGVRVLSRHTFAAFQMHVARSGDTVRVVTLRPRTRMNLPLQDYCGGLYFDPTGFEPRTVRWVAEHLCRGDVFVDIGANIGYYTLIAASVLREKGGGKVLAFEPNPTVHQLLADSVQLSQLQEVVTLFPWAVSRADGEKATFYLADSANSGLSSLQPAEGHLKAGALSASRTIEVECRSLDALLRDGHIRRADIIKIDVELAELEVLAGGQSLLRQLRPRYIICETSLDSKASNLLRGMGYDATVLESLSPDSANWGNILFTATDKRAGA